LSHGDQSTTWPTETSMLSNRFYLTVAGRLRRAVIFMTACVVLKYAGSRPCGFRWND